MSHRGFTLVEMIVSVAIGSMIVLTAATVLLYASQASNSIRIHSELFVGAQRTVSFITEQMSVSVAYYLDKDEYTNSLNSIEFYGSISAAIGDAQVIIFNRLEGEVRFGGFTNAGHAVTHTLANNIEDILISVEDGLMTVEVITKNRVSEYSNIEVEPAVIRTVIDVRHKANIRL